MRLTEVLKEGKKLVSELVSELDEVELAFYQHNPADIDQITIRVIDEVVPKKADELLRLAAKWLGLAREADRIMPNVLGYVGVSNEGLPVREIVDTTERWIQERGSYPQLYSG